MNWTYWVYPYRLHKALAWIHGPGMILPPILGAIACNQLSNGEMLQLVTMPIKNEMAMKVDMTWHPA